MSRSARSAFLGAALLLATFSASGAEGAAESSSSTWTVGIAKFSVVEGSEAYAILLSVIPKLIIGQLQSLPIRRAPREFLLEAEAIKVARARFAAGTELASKLDDRSAKYLDPSVQGAEKSYGMKSADKAVRDSAKKLKETLMGAVDPDAEGDEEPREVELTVKLWDGHAKGMLIDPPGVELAKAAKTAGLDFLLTGSVALVGSGYARVELSGYDASLAREVFSYSSHCALDDPEPLAREIADRLERHIAGREFSRVDVDTEPSGAELYIDGHPISSSARVAYVYKPGVIHLSAALAGYEGASVDIPLGLGERKNVELRLEAKETGKVSLTTDPPGAAVDLDSMPLGSAPAEILLDGTRMVLNVAAEGMEPQTTVLPTEGESSLEIKLQPSDGIGPTGRINAAKDDFYWAFGWFAASVPITTLTYGIYNGYDEAYQRSGSASLEYSRWNASRALAVACAITATTAVVMIFRLVKYLKKAR